MLYLSLYIHTYISYLHIYVDRIVGASTAKKRGGYNGERQRSSFAATQGRDAPISFLKPRRVGGGGEEL